MKSESHGYAPGVRTFVRFLVWTALLISLVIGLARATVVRWLRISTTDPVFATSLLPTLRAGDLILVQRVTRPVMGDLVLCPEPDYPDRYIIGRIVGEPGDAVELRDGEVFVNGKTFTQERSCDPPVIYYPHPANETEEVKQSCGWEAIANHLHMRGNASGPQAETHNIQFDVVEGKFFLISDNRLYPYDSRDYGLVDIASCKETVFARLVSRDGWMDSENRLDYIQ